MRDLKYVFIMNIVIIYLKVVLLCKKTSSILSFNNLNRNSKCRNLKVPSTPKRRVLKTLIQIYKPIFRIVLI